MSEKFLGIISIILSVGLVICLLASFGYNTYLSVSKEKIEVQTTNSNSQNKTTIE